jgi:hypothetical protein
MEVTGFTCLAAGADQIFAQEVLDAGGSLVAVIPCTRYEQTFDDEGLITFESLKAQCIDVITLDFPEPTEEAFMEAGKQVMDSSEMIVAIWDGQPALGLGGTGDAVDYARNQGKPVEVIWPEGVMR